MNNLNELINEGIDVLYNQQDEDENEEEKNNIRDFINLMYQEKNNCNTEMIRLINIQTNIPRQVSKDIEKLNEFYKKNLKDINKNDKNKQENKYEEKLKKTINIIKNLIKIIKELIEVKVPYINKLWTATNIFNNNLNPNLNEEYEYKLNINDYKFFNLLKQELENIKKQLDKCLKFVKKNKKNFQENSVEKTKFCRNSETVGSC